MPDILYFVTPKLDTPGIRDLNQAAESLGISYENLLLGDPGTPSALVHAKHAIYRFGPKSVKQMVALREFLGSSSAAREVTAVLSAFDKCESYNILSSRGVAMPKSRVINDSNSSPFMPVVIKPAIGNQGNGVVLARSDEDYLRIARDYLSDGRFLAQEYIAESKSSDKRLIVANGTVLAAMKRTAAEGDFRANLHLGGSAQIYTPSSQEVKQAVDACVALDLRLGGVDIIDSNSGPLVLEVNPSPGFGISGIIGMDVAKKVVQTYLKGGS